jgi:hypothetical protein
MIFFENLPTQQLKYLYLKFLHEAFNEDLLKIITKNHRCLY